MGSHPPDPVEVVTVTHMSARRESRCLGPSWRAARLVGPCAGPRGGGFLPAEVKRFVGWRLG